MASPTFKVIVIGGGPVGLVAAHALFLAGIDFVVLEGREQLLEDVGASLVLFPQSLRVFAQLGILDALRPIGQEVLRWGDYAADGRLIKEGWHTIWVKRNHGSYSLMFHRAQLIETIYEGLPESAKSRVLTGKKLGGVETTPDGVVVSCADGSQFAGSMVLGADGVHSKTRGIMRELSLRPATRAFTDLKKPSGVHVEVNEATVDTSDDEARSTPLAEHKVSEAASSNVNPLHPYSTEYKLLWCSFPRRYEYAAGDHCVTHADDVSLQFLNGKDRSWIFIYERLQPSFRAAPSSLPQPHYRYTGDDVAAFGAKHADLPIGDLGLKLGDVFDLRTSGGMADLQEGALRHWHGAKGSPAEGRVVLAGDAAHKYTPNAGLGLNAGIQDVVALVNGLHKYLSGYRDDEGEKQEHEGKPKGEKDRLHEVFTTYQTQRLAAVDGDVDRSARITRLWAWPNSIYWLLDRWVLPWLPRSGEMFVRLVVSPRVAEGGVLDFVEGDGEVFEGLVPWVHRMPVRAPKREKKVAARL